MPGDHLGIPNPGRLALAYGQRHAGRLRNLAGIKPEPQRGGSQLPVRPMRAWMIPGAAARTVTGCQSRHRQRRSSSTRRQRQPFQQAVHGLTDARIAVRVKRVQVVKRIGGFVGTVHAKPDDRAGDSAGISTSALDLAICYQNNCSLCRWDMR